jgi:hypothetical protein
MRRPALPTIAPGSCPLLASAVASGVSVVFIVLR